MQRLTGLDAGFYAMDEPTHPMAAVHFAVLRDHHPDGPRPITVEMLADHLERRLHLLPAFRRRVVKVPLGLHHPVWIEDPDFDLARQLRVVTLPAPGGDGELEQAIAHIAEWPLDLNLPLWRCTLIDGFADGRTAVALSTHHALSDGRGIITMFDRLFLPDDDVPPVDQPWRPEPRPGRARLIADALRDHRRLWPRLPALATRTIAGFKAVEQRRSEADVYVPQAGDVVLNSLNESHVPDRVFRHTTFPLDDFKRIRRASGVTMTDVLFGLVAGTLRHYLAGRGEPIDHPLVANNTVLTDAGDPTPRTSGNHMSSLSVALPIDEPDPWRRLQLIHAEMDEAKAQFDLLGSTVLEDWLEFSVPLVSVPAAKGYEQFVLRRNGGTGLDRPGFNVAASNVPGARHRYRLGHVEVVELCMNGILTPGVGVFLGMISYGDEAFVPVLASPDALPDPEAMIDALHVAHQELLAAAVLHETDTASPDRLTEIS